MLPNRQMRILEEIARQKEPVGNAIHLAAKGQSHLQAIYLVGVLLEKGLVTATVVQMDGFHDFIHIQPTPEGRELAHINRQNTQRRNRLLGVFAAFMVLPLLASALWVSGLLPFSVWRIVQIHTPLVGTIFMGLLGSAMVLAWWEPWK